MRKYKKEQTQVYLKLFYKIHEALYIGVQQDTSTVDEMCELLTTCQQKAIELGNMLEQEGTSTQKTVSLLEDYCEKLYQMSQSLIVNQIGADSLKAILDTCANKIKRSIAEDIPTEKVVLFLPYNVNMWDSLKGFYEKAVAEENCTAYVVPIPYFSKSSDGSNVELNYHINDYPKNVPVISYTEFDFGMHPDEIYIHNPYDGFNFVTSVPEFFFSKNIKRFTSKLIYVPYFVLDEPDLENSKILEEMEHFVLLPGVINSDRVIVQSENMKQAYVTVLTGKYGEETRKMWEEKISGEGSSKIESAKKSSKNDVEIPDEWKHLIMGENNTPKKVILYNTSVTALLRHRSEMIKKIQRTLDIFEENSSKICLLWRPHPLLEDTMKSMCPEYLQVYHALVNDYKKKGFGIFDDSKDFDRALALADAYYGDPSSVVQLCQARNIPVMIQNVQI